MKRSGVPSRCAAPHLAGVAHTVSPPGATCQPWVRRSAAAPETLKGAGLATVVAKEVAGMVGTGPVVTTP